MVGWAVKHTKFCMQGAGVVTRSLEWPQWADRSEAKHWVATGLAQPSCPSPVTRLPGMGHFQSSNWEITQQAKKSGSVWPPSTCPRAGASLILCSMENLSSPDICDVSHLSAWRTGRSASWGFYRPRGERNRVSWSHRHGEIIKRFCWVRLGKQKNWKWLRVLIEMYFKFTVLSIISFCSTEKHLWNNN